MARRMVYRGSNDGSSPILRQVPVNASQVILKGSIVVESTGKASVAASGAAEGTVIGVAAQDYTTSSSVTDKDVILVDVSPNAIYEVPTKGTTKTKVAQSDIGKVFDVSNAYTADLDKTTDGFLKVVGVSTERNTIFAQIQHRVQTV